MGDDPGNPRFVSRPEGLRPRTRDRNHSRTTLVRDYRGHSGADKWALELERKYEKDRSVAANQKAGLALRTPSCTRIPVKS